MQVEKYKWEAQYIKVQYTDVQERKSTVQMYNIKVYKI